MVLKFKSHSWLGIGWKPQGATCSPFHQPEESNQIDNALRFSSTAIGIFLTIYQFFSQYN